MGATNQIDHIDFEGVRYEFLDQTARSGVDALAKRVQQLNEAQTQALGEEKTRAQNAEQALEDSKVTKEQGKGLSTNDFDNSYKDLLDNPRAMQGAGENLDGVQGDVPAPSAGQQDKYLRGDGQWETPHDTTYDLVTQSADGLMSHQDKEKLDAMDRDNDDTVACNTVFGNGTITETLGNGKTKTTTFNADGSITQTIAKAGMDTITLRTVFNADGSITRTRS